MDTKQSIVNIMKDYMYYGENFTSFLDKDYPICKTFTEIELKEIWINTRGKLSSEF